MRHLSTDNTELNQADDTQDSPKWTGGITQDSPGGQNQMVDKVDKKSLPELWAESEVGAVSD